MISSLQGHVDSLYLIFFVVDQYSQVPCSAALNPLILQSVLILLIAPTQARNFACDPVELHEVHVDTLLKPLRVPLGGMPLTNQLHHSACYYL